MKELKLKCVTQYGEEQENKFYLGAPHPEIHPFYFQNAYLKRSKNAELKKGMYDYVKSLQEQGLQEKRPVLTILEEVINKGNS